ncbi:hypothetical protein [Aquirhabdus parva]|uniref:Condensation domain-containing protein n=1 Tax=Aquirhabdus parva TaxID=2283318 RepID=A0A345P387_9GAMM|nr:hypothetical protein [Aquirhabdus parva]AXI01746.1 hypothetical protein HYN46_01880 [Aquirhabdus parva]
MSQPRYVRRLSALERYSLVLDRVYRYHVDAILEGRGHVDTAQLQRAVDQAAAANPAIRVRLRGFLAYTKWVDSGISPQVREMPLSDWDGNSERGAAFLKERFDVMRGGAVVDVLVVPCRDGYTRIVFRALHAAFDGRGCLHWVNEICRAMRGDALHGSDSSLTDLDIQAQYENQIEPEPPQPPSNCIPVIPPAVDHTQQPLAYIWRRTVIDNNVSQMLTRTAVFLAEWARKREEGDVGFTIPIDYRGLRTNEMSIGNLTGYVRLTVPPNATSRQLMQQLIGKIRAKADCRQFPGIRKLLWMPVWLMLRQLMPKVDAILHTVTPALPSGGIVSMGNFVPQDYSFEGFDAHMLYGIPGAVGKLNVVFINYPNYTVVSIAAPATYNDHGQLDELITAFQQHFSNTGITP